MVCACALYFYEKLLIPFLSNQYALLLIPLCIYFVVHLFKLRKHRNKSPTIEKMLAKFKPQVLFENTLEMNREAEMMLDDAETVNMVKMDFLGLCGNMEIREVAADCIRKYGVGTCGPRSFYGSTVIHKEVENKLAAFCGTEISLIYSYGAMTCSSIISTYVTSKDIAFVDELVNKQILMGLKARRPKVHCFKHNRFDDLADVLKEMERGEDFDEYQARFLILEGVYENTGSICKLKELLRVARCYKLRIIIDESLSFGVLGDTGRGITEHCNVDVREIDIICGSLEYVFGTTGGFCIGAQITIENQQMLSLSFAFSASLPTFLARSMLTALDYIGEKPVHLRQLSRDVDTFLHKIDNFYNILSHAESPRKVLMVKNVFEQFEMEIVHSEIVSFCRDNFSVYLTSSVFGVIFNLNHDLCFDEIKKDKLFTALEASTFLIENFYEQKQIKYDVKTIK